MKGVGFRSPPEEGVYISGLFIEAARWDEQEGSLVESLPGELVSQAPIIWLNERDESKHAHGVPRSTKLALATCSVPTNSKQTRHVDRPKCP